MFALAGVVAFAGGCASGESIRDESGRVVSSGEWSVYDLRPGDCLGELSDQGGAVDTVPLVPCETEHTVEVFAVALYPGSDYPGAQELATYGDNTCLTALETEFGLSPSDSLFVSYLLPSADSWEADGDRSVVCVIVSDPGNPTMGSLVDGTADL